MDLHHLQLSFNRSSMSLLAMPTCLVWTNYRASVFGLKHLSVTHTKLYHPVFTA